MFNGEMGTEMGVQIRAWEWRQKWLEYHKGKNIGRGPLGTNANPASGLLPRFTSDSLLGNASNTNAGPHSATGPFGFVFQ